MAGLIISLQVLFSFSVIVGLMDPMSNHFTAILVMEKYLNIQYVCIVSDFLKMHTSTYLNNEILFDFKRNLQDSIHF